jgi:hypothetical protein
MSPFGRSPLGRAAALDGLEIYANGLRLARKLIRVEPRAWPAIYRLTSDGMHCVQMWIKYPV